jgi:hypothetical protein
MSDKLTDMVSLRLAASEYRQLVGLADMGGLTVSAYVRELVISHLDVKRAHYEHMRQVFDHTANPANPANPGYTANPGHPVNTGTEHHTHTYTHR